MGFCLLKLYATPLGLYHWRAEKHGRNCSSDIFARAPPILWGPSTAFDPPLKISLTAVHIPIRLDSFHPLYHHHCYKSIQV